MKKLILGVLVIGFCLIHNPQPLGAVTTDMFPEPEPPSLTINDYLTQIFGSKAEIARAVIIHESGNNLDAINYNCRYNGKSQSCKKGDTAKAWSVDCGIGQVNVIGKKCPAKLLTLEGNMEAVKNIYETQGLKAWVSYTSGAYKQYMS